MYKPVAMVGSSFVGELSVDIEEMQRLDPEIYYEVVGLWARADGRPRSAASWSTTPSSAPAPSPSPTTSRRSDPRHLAGRHVQHRPRPRGLRTRAAAARDQHHRQRLLPLHVVRDATLPGVVHNRNIVNYYTPERRTGPGFTAYQLRWTKFFLSMLYLYPVYTEMERVRGALLDERHHVRADAIGALVAESTGRTAPRTSATRRPRSLLPPTGRKIRRVRRPPRAAAAIGCSTRRRRTSRTSRCSSRRGGRW